MYLIELENRIQCLVSLLRFLPLSFEVKTWLCVKLQVFFNDQANKH